MATNLFGDFPRISYTLDDYDSEQVVVDIFKRVVLSKEFKETLDKAKNLKSTFISFLKSIDINVGSIMTMLSYAFMIPSIGPIIHLIQSGNVSHDEVKLFVSSLFISSLI